MIPKERPRSVISSSCRKIGDDLGTSLVFVNSVNGQKIFDKIKDDMIFKETNLETSEIKYQLRYWSFVELLDEPINDPDDHSRERYVFPLSEALEKLNWGEIGDGLVKLACQNIEKYE